MKKNKRIIKSNLRGQEIEKSNYLFKPILVFILSTFILYSNTLKNDYALDDAIVITNNVFTQNGIKDLSKILKYDTFTGFWLNSYKDKTPEEIQEEKKLVAGGRYRPLSLISFAIEIQLFGKDIKDDNGNVIYKGNPFVSHLVNIILYLFSVIILYFILLKIIPKSLSNSWFLSIPFLCGLLFLFHPIHTEVVANIKGRDEIMCLIAALSALWFSLRFIETNKKRNLAYSSIAMFLGLLSKENAICFLAIIPLTIYYFTNSSLKKNLITLIPLLIASLVFLVIRANVLGIASDKQIVSEILNNPFLNSTFLEKIATIFYTLFLYLKLLVFPHPLTYDYYPWHISIIDTTSLKAILPFILYLLLGIYAVYGFIKKKDVLSYSIWFYLLTLSVVSNLFFPIGTFMNERFIFISSIGFCLALAYILVFIIFKFVKDRKKASLILTVLMVCILSVYALKTINRNKVWKNDLSLFTSDVKVSSKSAKSNCSAGGKLIEEAQRPINKQNQAAHDSLCLMAIDYLNKSIEIYPNYADALNLLGNAYFEYNHDIARSLDYYARVLKIYKNNSLAYNNAKMVLNTSISLINDKLTDSSPEEILESCKKLVDVQPKMGEAYHLIGKLYGQYLNDLESSIMYLEIANECEFDKSAEFYADLGVAYGISANYTLAKEYFLKSAELKPNNYQTLINLGITYKKLGEVENSNICFDKAEALKR